MADLLKNRYFTIEIENVDLTGGIDPYDRRIDLLKEAGINLPPLDAPLSDA